MTLTTHEPASIFVASLGASGLVFARAFPDQKLPAWIAGHVQALAFYGGVPSLIVRDNPRTAVTKPCRFEPILHRTYQELAEHYGTVVLPARPRKPDGQEDGVRRTLTVLLPGGVVTEFDGRSGSDHETKLA